MGILDYLGGKYDEYKQSEMPLAYLLRGDYQGFPEAYKQNAINSSYGLLKDTMEGKNLPMGGILGKTKIASKTEMELANEIASKNAETMLGLPKGNTAMDRAKAMGFDVDTTMYHGTNKNFNEFKDWRTNPIRSQEGIFFTDDKYLAKEYGKKIKDVYLKKGNVNSYDAKGKSFSDSEAQDFLLNATRRLNGISSVEMKNFVDAPSPFMNASTNPSTIIAVNRPNQIRSINAAFDPARANESDILAGMMAFPVSGLLQEPKKKKNK